MWITNNNSFLTNSSSMFSPSSLLGSQHQPAGAGHHLPHIKGDFDISSSALGQHHRKESRQSNMIPSFYRLELSISNWELCGEMRLYLHHRNSKIFFHPAKFDNFKDEKISDFKTVSVSQRKNLLDWKLVV